MKHIRIFSALLLMLTAFGVLSSCSSDDKLKTAEVIVGSWTLDSYSVEGVNVPEGTVINLQQVTFTADGLFTVVLPDGSTDGGTYSASDDSVTLYYRDTVGDVTRRLLCEVMSVAERSLTLSYKDDESHSRITVILLRQ